MDIIEKAAEALAPISAEGVPVQQGWYDEKLHKTHVTLYKLDTTPAASSDDDLEVVTEDVQVTIFGPTDEVQLYERIRKLMTAYGFTWTAGGQDDTLDDGGVFMKPQRFSYTTEV